MAKPPRRPREIKRSSEAESAAVASRPLVRRRDPRQAELFVTSFIPPCKPTLVATPPKGAAGGSRSSTTAIASRATSTPASARVYTKSGFDWADRMPAITAALERLPVDSAVIDAEAVMVGEDGISDFFRSAQGSGRQAGAAGLPLRLRPSASRRPGSEESFRWTSAGCSLRIC